MFFAYQLPLPRPLGVMPFPVLQAVAGEVEPAGAPGYRAGLGDAAVLDGEGNFSGGDVVVYLDYVVGNPDLPAGVGDLQAEYAITVGNG